MKSYWLLELKYRLEKWITLPKYTWVVVLIFIVVFSVKTVTATVINFQTTSGYFTSEFTHNLSEPFNRPEKFNELTQTQLWQEVLSHLWVNRDKQNPTFARGDSKEWNEIASVIPANVVGIQISKDRRFALIYRSGVPDYTIETPPFLANYTPGNIHNILKLTVSPTLDDNNIHEIPSKGAIGVFANGSSIFSYTDTFSYNDKKAWSYNANVAEALIVNSDIAHVTPHDDPLLPKSPGIFHNHQSSALFLQELGDPFTKGNLSHSLRVGSAIDNNPIYGPIGYTTENGSDKLKVLHSSYVTRDWLEEKNGGTGHRSSLPEWTVINWDGSNEKGDSVLNIFQAKKTDLLYSDGRLDATVQYDGSDAALAKEIEALKKAHTLQEDALGYAYWKAKVTLPNGKTAFKRNYLLKSSELWGAGFSEKILPVFYVKDEKDKFLFQALISSFAEDYDFVEGYGDLDFYNGISSYIPELKSPKYHYVVSYSADLADKKRLSKSSFPYYVGIQYKSKVEEFNNQLDDQPKVKFFETSSDQLETVYDLGIIGKEKDGTLMKGSVIKEWQAKLNQ